MTYPCDLGEGYFVTNVACGVNLRRCPRRVEGTVRRPRDRGEHDADHNQSVFMILPPSYRAGSLTIAGVHFVPVGVCNKSLRY